MLLACSTKKPVSSKKKIEKVEDESLDIIYENMNNLSFIILANAENSGAENLLFSSPGVNGVLALLKEGAAGKSLIELNTAGISSLPEELAFETRLGKNNAVKLTSTAWVKEGMALSSGFSEKLEVAPEKLNWIDFNDKKAAQTINNWVKENTNGKIDKLIEESDLHSLVRLVVTSALSFEGKWQLPFEPSKTEKGTFFQTKSKVQNTEFMRQKSSFPFLKTASASWLKLAFSEGNEVELILLLPNEKEGLTSEIKALSLESFNANLDKFSEQEVELSLPKVDITEKSDLVPVFQQLGVTSIFNETEADFSELSKEPLFVEKLFQKNRLKWDETGAEAASATGAIVATRMAPKTQKFKADHPFAFFLRDSATGVILMTGTISNVKP